MTTELFAIKWLSIGYIGGVLHAVHTLCTRCAFFVQEHIQVGIVLPTTPNDDPCDASI